MRSEIRSVTLLLRSPEEANHNPGGSPNIILMKVGTEGSPVVVDIEQAYLEVPGRLYIQPATHFIRNAILRSRVPTGPADGRVGAASPNQPFHKWG